MNSTKIKIFIKNKNRIIYKNCNKYYYRHNNKYINISKKYIFNTKYYGGVDNDNSPVNNNDDIKNKIKEEKIKISKLETIQLKIDFYKKIIKYNIINNIKNLFIFIEKYRVLLIKLIDNKFGDKENNEELLKSIKSTIKIIFFDKILLNYLVNILPFYINNNDENINKLINILSFDEKSENLNKKIMDIINNKITELEKKYESYITDIDNKNKEYDKKINNEDDIYKFDVSFLNKILEKLSSEYDNTKQNILDKKKDVLNVKEQWNILSEIAMKEVENNYIVNINYNDDIKIYKKNFIDFIDNILKIGNELNFYNFQYDEKYNSIIEKYNSIIEKSFKIKDGIDVKVNQDTHKNILINIVNLMSILLKSMIFKIENKYREYFDKLNELYNDNILK